MTESGDDRGASSLGTLAGRLDYLFRTVHPPGRRPFSYDHVAEAITRDQGIDISSNYIWMLRSGRRDNPTLRHLEGLARFFAVSPAFLVDQDVAERVRARLEKLGDPAASGLQPAAARGDSVDDDALDAIYSLLVRAHDLMHARADSGLRAGNQPKPRHDDDETSEAGR